MSTYGVWGTGKECVGEASQKRRRAMGGVQVRCVRKEYIRPGCGEPQVEYELLYRQPKHESPKLAPSWAGPMVPVPQEGPMMGVRRLIAALRGHGIQWR
jgi:hypothetical protein